MKFLTLIRHGCASFPDLGGADHDRPLIDQGRRDAGAVGRWLAKGVGGGRFPLPSKVVASSALRTVETVNELVLGLGDWGGGVEIDPALYLASERGLLARIQNEAPETEHLVVVAHNPGLHALADRLVFGRRELAFPEATAQVTRYSAEWWELVEVGDGGWVATVSPGNPELS